MFKPLAYRSKPVVSPAWCQRRALSFCSHLAPMVHKMVWMVFLEIAGVSGSKAVLPQPGEENSCWVGSWLHCMRMWGPTP